MYFLTRICFGPNWNHQVIQFEIYFGTEKEYISKLLDRNHHIFRDFQIVVSVWIYESNSTREVPVHVIHYYRTEDVTLPPCISRVGTISSATAALLLSILFWLQSLSYEIDYYYLISSSSERLIISFLEDFRPLLNDQIGSIWFFRQQH